MANVEYPVTVQELSLVGFTGRWVKDLGKIFPNFATLPEINSSHLKLNTPLEKQIPNLETITF